MRTALPLLAALAVGCDAETQDTAPGSATTVDSGLLPCGTTPPVLGSATQTAATSPELVLGMVPTDADGALHDFTVTVWVDASVDGAVDVASTPLATLDRADMEGLSAEDRCGAIGGFPLSLAFDPDDHDELVRGTPVDVGLQLTDADGLSSELVVIEACVPETDGSQTCP